MRHSLHKVSLLLLFLLPFLFLFESAYSEKILVLSFISTKSHKITYMRLIEELAKRGHQITVVTPIKATKVTPNIKEVYTFDVDPIFFASAQDNDPLKMKANNESLNPFKIEAKLREVCKISYGLPQVRDLLDEKFHLIFIPTTLNECSLGIVHKLKAPVVLFCPTSVPDIVTSKLGSRLPPSTAPFIMLDYTSEMTFWQRFVNFGAVTVFELLTKFVIEPNMEKLYREELGDESIPSIREILGNASLVLSNGHFSISGPRPYLPDVIDVGGMHSEPAKPLSQELENFVSKKGSKGFIYFSMGTVINTETMPQERRELFLSVFSKLKDYQIVWKWHSKDMPNKPENVYISNWLPQQDLLGHKNIRLFITHCGGGGTEEAIYHGVPLLGMPIIGDQPMNAKLAKRLGFLVELDWNAVTEENLMSSINEVLHNSKYRENVKRLSTILKDQPGDPLERGVYWIEYVLRHQSAPHLRSASRKLNYFQYHSWDIIATYLTIIVVGLYIVVCLLKFVCKKVRTILFRNQAKTKQSKKNN